MSNKLKTLAPYMIALLIAIILVITILPSRMEYDEGIWFYQARLWVENGMAPYTFTIENKTPGILYIYTISYYFFHNSIWFPKVLGIISIVLASLVMYVIGRKLVSPFAGIMAQMILGFLACSPLVQADWVQHPESYLALFTPLAFYFLIKNMNGISKDISFSNSIIAGSLMGISIIFKQIALVSALALFLYIILYSKYNHSNPGKVLRLIAGYGSGILVCYFVLSIPVFLSHVSFGAYFQNAWIILLDGRMSLKPNLSHRLMGMGRLLNTYEAKLIIAFFLLFLIRRKDFPAEVFWGVLIWFLLDTFGALSSGTYYGHQFKQFLPPAALIAGMVLHTLQIKFRINSLLLFLFVFLIFFPVNGFITYAYFRKDGSSPEEFTFLGNWIQKNSSPGDPIIIWGGNTNTRVLAYSHRKTPGKYFDLEFLGNQKSMEQYKKDFFRNKPLYILQTTFNNEHGSVYFRKPPWLADELRENYELYRISGDYFIYKAKKTPNKNENSNVIQSPE